MKGKMIMATATKKRPVKRVAAEKAAPAKATRKGKAEEEVDDEANGSEPKPRGRQRNVEQDAEYTEALLEAVEINGEFGTPGLRVTGIGAAAEELGIDSIRAKQLIMRHLAEEAGYPLDESEATPENIAASREENGGLDWLTIDLMYGTSRSKSHSLYDEARGDGAHSEKRLFGQGGVDRIREKAEPKPKKEKGKGSTKELTPIFDGDEPKGDIVSRLDGKKVKVHSTAGGVEKVATVTVSNPKVGTVKGVRVVKYTDQKGNARTTAVESFVK